MRRHWNQLIVVNVVLAAAAVTVCLGAPIIPAIVGAVAAGMLLFVGRSVFIRWIGSPHAGVRSPRGE